MKFLTALLLSAGVVSACGDNAYRCKNPNKSIDEEWEATRRICQELGEETCYCYHWAEYYCDPYGDNIDRFKSKCEAWGDDWYWNEC